MKFLLPLLLCFVLNHALFSQCEIVSSRGWTATVEVTPVAAVVNSGNCPWYYHYEVQFDYTVTFSGSTDNRGLNVNVYLECSGGTGGSPFVSLGYFNTDAQGTRTTNNNSRGYSAVGPAYNYGDNPSCSEITISDIGCNMVRLGYWGAGVTGGSLECSAMAVALPIELAEFAAERHSYGTLLEWTTFSELNNDFFLVEKSYDAEEWQEIERVDGAGTSSAEMTYTALDRHENTTVYYRLTQVDFDGKSETFAPIVVTPGNASEGDMPYPNPVDRVLRVPGLSDSHELSLLNAAGQEIEKQIINREGDQVFLGKVPNGVYLLQASGVNQTEQYKILVKH